VEAVANDIVASAGVSPRRQPWMRSSEMEVDMRKLIAGMKISVDGKIEGPENGADWVEAWSEDYG